jgi:magnesium chelatase subunit D
VAELEAETARVFALERPLDPLERAAAGRRVRSLVSLHRGKYSRHRLARRDSTDLALDATLRAAAARAGTRRLPRIAVSGEDLRRKVRSHRSPFAVVFVVDNSYSVHAERMVERVKGLTLRLLEDAAHRGDRVALVAFKGGVPEATVAVPLTRSLPLARRRLESVPLSGRTPLADALARARRLLRQELLKHPNAVPLVVCVTDGLPTVALRPGGDPVADALAEARELRRARIACVVADAAPPPQRAQGIGAALAEAAGGLHLPFEQLVPGTFAELLAAIEAS